MSKLVIVGVFDRAVQAYVNVSAVSTRQVALRGFIDEVNKADSQLNAHAQDFELYELAVIDQESGLIVESGVNIIARAQDVKSSANGVI